MPWRTGCASKVWATQSSARACCRTEIITTRLIRSKKPWAVAAAAMLMTGLAANYLSYASSWDTVDVDNEWKSSLSRSQTETQRAGGFTSEDGELRSQFESIKTIGDNLQTNAEGRLLWLELLKAVDAAVPTDDRPEADREKSAKDVSEREELHIESIDCQFFPNLGQWFSGQVETMYSKALQSQELAETEAAEAAEAAGQLEGDASADGAEAEAGAEGETVEGEAAAAPAEGPCG